MTSVPTSLKGLLNERWRRYSDSVAACSFFILFTIAQRVYLPPCSRDECCTRRDAVVDSAVRVLVRLSVSTAFATTERSIIIANYNIEPLLVLTLVAISASICLRLSVIDCACGARRRRLRLGEDTSPAMAYTHKDQLHTLPLV
jgi:hypothetical protein